MPEYAAKLMSQRIIAHETREFVFEKPTGFDFKPGQFMTLILPDLDMKVPKGNRRSMSIASSPTESNISFGMRMGTSAFKQRIEKLKPGEAINLMGPFGHFTMPDDVNQPLVFLAGGIGITPFLGMIKYSIDTKSPRQLYLLYGNSCISNSSYLPEIEALTKRSDKLHYLPTMSDLTHLEHEWKGQTGFINADLIKKTVPDHMRPTYMIVGPPGMVEAMVALLKEMGLPDTQIIIEKFTGY
ncbi:MAG: FAD-dependent oxidoreductase [Candidatus Kerfeldbacteria bacterium]|nr:FAD-dependent oxidoreductase [Candidatus Kerfeldbacteria bacterium]